MRKHDDAVTVTPSDFDNTLAEMVGQGQTIVERDAKGRVIHRAQVLTQPIVNPIGCKQHVHVTVKVNGSRHVWCYDIGSRVEAE